LFVVARHLWLIGLHTNFYPNNFGIVNLDDGSFNRYYGGLHKLIEQHMPDLVLSINSALQHAE